MEAASTTSSAGSSVDGGGSRSVGNDYLNRQMFDSSNNPLGGYASTTSNTFDLSSDFPSLGDNAAPGNGLAAALREQQQLAAMAHQQMLQGTKIQNQGSLYMLAMKSANGGHFNMASEDFPALGGTPANSGNGSSLNVSSLLSNSAVQPSNENGLYGGSLEGASQLEGATGLLGNAGLGNLSSGLRNPSGAIGSSSGASASATGTALNGDFGLLGLLGVIRMTDADRNALALGSDLQLLGLNLGSGEQLYNTFASPWTEGNQSKEPHFQLPSCYYMQPPALKTGHLSKFQLETLFYIFYALPKDVLQAYAAQELYSREWRYHGEHKLWFKRAGPSDGVAANASTIQYLYFDISSWERRLFNGNMSQITSGFLPEEEVRVKFPSS